MHDFFLFVFFHLQVNTCCCGRCFSIQLLMVGGEREDIKFDLCVCVCVCVSLGLFPARPTDAAAAQGLLLARTVSCPLLRMTVFWRRSLYALLVLPPCD